MHIVFVDSNEAALEAIECAKDEGHRVSFIESADPYYPRTAENLRLIGRADWIARDVVTTDVAAVTAALAECHAWHPIDFAVTQFELIAEAVALSCKALGLRGTSPDAVLITRHKDLLRAALREAGLAMPSFAVARDCDEVLAAADAIGYPVVIKPPSGADSKLVSVAGDPAQARAACAHALDLDAVPPLWREQLARGFLVEEHLAGPMVSVEIGMRDGRGYLLCITGRTRARDDEVIEIGGHIPAELPEDQARACAAYAESVCRTIGLDLGVFHLEMIVTPRGPVLVEANPRIIGGILPTVYRHAAGHSIYRVLLQVVSGARVDCTRGVFDGCVTGRRFFARTDGRLPGSWDTSWLAGYAGELIRFDPPEALGLRPGQPVRRGDVLARVIVRGADYAATVKTGAQITARMGESVGIEPMAGEYDC